MGLTERIVESYNAVVSNQDEQPPSKNNPLRAAWQRLKPREQGLLIGVVLGFALVGMITLIALVFGRTRQPLYPPLEKPIPQYIVIYPTAPYTPTLPAKSPAAESEPGWLEPLAPTPANAPTAISQPAGPGISPPGPTPSFSPANPPPPIVPTRPARLWFDTEETGLVTNAEVNQAIRRGTEYLWSLQKPTGEWVSSEDNKFPGGTTLLTVLTLRTLGTPANDPRLDSALTFLLTITKDANYANYQRSLRILTFLAMNSRKYSRIILEDQAALLAAQHKNGGWNYEKSEAAGSDRPPDNSNSQFAVLALFEADRAGYVAPVESLHRALDYWQAMQNVDGGFAYYSNMVRPSYGSMTAAGFASMVLLDDTLSGHRVGGNRDRVAIPQTRAMEWLNQKFASQNDLEWLGQFDWRNGMYYYGLYALERAGHAGGLKYLGGKDWYRTGCAQLINSQNKDGSWSGRGREGQPINAEVQTCFALLFASKGQMPVVANKLRYEGNWNCTPRDLRLLSRWLTESRERPVTWQIVSAGSASLSADLFDAPLLYVTGTGPVSLAPQDQTALCQYVRLGGTIVAVQGPVTHGHGPEPAGADHIFSSGPIRPTATPGRLRVGPKGEIVMDVGGSPVPRATSFADGIKSLPTPTSGTWDKSATSQAAGPFADSVRDQLDAILVPLGFTRKPLPADHPLWNLIHILPPMTGAEGWTDGIVWRAFLLPAELGVDWDQNALKTRVTSFHLATNLLVLATEGVGLAPRLRPALPGALRELPLPTVSGPSAPVWPSETEPADLRVALARHEGQWLAGEMALGRLAELAAKKLRINVGLQLGVDPGAEIPPDTNLLWISGTTDPKLTPAHWQQLKNFGRRGGFMVFNAAASSPAFTSAVLPELKREFGPAGVEPLPIAHPLITGQPAADGWCDLTRLALRRPRARAGQPVHPLEAPRPVEFYGLRLEGKLVGVFCPVDLTYGLTGGPSTDLVGYTQEGCRQIGLNLLNVARLKPEGREKSDR